MNLHEYQASPFFNTSHVTSPDGSLYDFTVTRCREESREKLIQRTRLRGVDFAAEVLASRSEICGWFLPPPASKILGIRAVMGKRIFMARRKFLRPGVLAAHPDRPDALRCGFTIAVRLQVGWNRVQLQSMDAAGEWRTFCRCDLRLSLLWSVKWRLAKRSRKRAEASFYDNWSRRCGDPDSKELKAMHCFLERFPRRPILSVLMPVYNTPERWLRAAIESVQRQIYPEWELCIADDCSTKPEVRRTLLEYAKRDPRIRVRFCEENRHICHASNSALELCTGEFTVLLDHDDELSPHALFHVAWELINHPTANVIFSDEDKITENGTRIHPYFKPGWNYDLLLGQNCVSHLGAFRTSLLRELGGFRPGYEGSQDWDVTLRAVARGDLGSVRHIPRVLYHWRTLPTSTSANLDAKPYAATAGRKAVADHLRATQPGAKLRELEKNLWQVIWPLPETEPLVSIIVSSKGRVASLRRTLDSHFRTTEYRRVEIIVVNHGAPCRATKKYLDALCSERGNVKIIPAAGRFHSSASGNHGARMAGGEVLVFLDSGIKIISPGWLRELVRQACRQDVGVVGACLLYPNHTIQHAGIVLNMAGVAGHVFRHSRPDAGSIGGPPHLAREVTAVTGACMTVRREIFERVGGFDEERLPVNFHDVDFCLRVRQLGLRNIYTPFAQLVYRESSTTSTLESASAQIADDFQEDIVLERWSQEFVRDNFFNPNLSLDAEWPALASAPSSVWPWLAGGTAKPAADASTLL